MLLKTMLDVGVIDGISDKYCQIVTIVRASLDMAMVENRDNVSYMLYE